ncbi:MAG: cysteine--1-D-myo-inosityl 2-amino-2-deoxy-alpha-D-glucopyranoside ligase [Actinomycetales bacterium]|nr:cysteine--1-D-myo-inosityl 2-amino-2-deoxy-alpha-D-glucopyranoside ligase [Actinomycetales bacterium]
MKSWAPPSMPDLPASPGTVRVRDSRTGEPLPVGRDGLASMYVCGITPYDATHLGHAATYLTFDLLNRVWRDAGLTVDFVQNVTDIDDPLLERAALTGQDWRDIAERETELFRTDMHALRVLPPSHYESAVESIPDVVSLIGQLPPAHAYTVDGDTYFHSAAVGQVCGWDRPAMETVFAQRGGDPARPGKRDPLDSLLWRTEREGEPAWPGALGPGRPGWHIECVAIALRHLHAPISVQGGGRDLLFPHHDMCNAQVLALTGRPLADAFMHTGLIGYQGEKMSKSLGNLVLVSQLRQRGVDLAAVRLALAEHHYSQDREWDEALLARGEARLQVWRAHADAPATDVLDEVRAALRNDLDTPAALALLDSCCAGATTEGGVTDGATLRAVADALLGVLL